MQQDKPRWAQSCVIADNVRRGLGARSWRTCEWLQMGWLILFISVYDGVALPTSAQHCLCHGEEPARRAVQGLGSPRCSIFSHRQPRNKKKTARGPGVPQRAGAHIWRNCKIGSAWVFPLPACHMFAVLACEWEAEWAGWGRLSQELFTWLPPCSIGSRHLFTAPPEETVVFGN